ncbi:MAG: trehalose-6-phosphate synthase, partial [Marmoricola sp.]
ELRQAFLVNPYDINGMKSQMMAAYSASPSDIARRMRAMRKTVQDNDVAHWAAAFLKALG